MRSAASVRISLCPCIGKCLLVLLAACCLSLQARPSIASPPAEGEKPPLPGPTLHVYFENDFFYNEDRYYTNAVQIRLVSPDLAALAENGYLPESVSRLVGKVPFPGRRKAVRYNLSLGVGQQIYTPDNTDAKTLQRDDRPYAGYLYGLLGLHAKQESRLDTLELAAGVVGPSALGKQVQNGIHRIGGIDRAEGWRNQLHDEPAVMLSWMRTWRLNAEKAPGGWGWDILPRMGVSLGTPFTGASLGGEVRFGWNLPPDYGSSSIRPGSGIMRPVEEGVPGAEEYARSESFKDRFSIYVFGGAEGRYVLWNTFLDGNLWRDSHDVDKFPFAGDLVGGLTVGLYDWTLTYTHVVRAKEFHGQQKAQYFGSITVSYRF